MKANPQASEQLKEAFLSACSELFSAYELRIQAPPTGGLEDTHYVSVLSATGEAIRLLSTLNFEPGLLAAIHPQGPQAGSDELGDWCRELNNQLVGRVKNKLLRAGCELMMGLPTLISGKELHTASSPELTTHAFSFGSPQGGLIATLAMHLSPDFRFEPVEAAVALEGELFLF